MGSVEVSDLETWQPKRLVIQYQFHLVGLSEIGLVDPSFHSFQFHINFIRIGTELNFDLKVGVLMFSQVRWHEWKVR